MGPWAFPTLSSVVTISAEIRNSVQTDMGTRLTLSLEGCLCSFGLESPACVSSSVEGGKDKVSLQALTSAKGPQDPLGPPRATVKRGWSLYVSQSHPFAV